jgi:mannose-1-phosphate guanylyltransferase
MNQINSAPPHAQHSWAIILAAGEGTRLASVTAAVHGSPIPKQFAAICGDRTFLQRTIDRVAPMIPPERTVVVVAAAHEALAHEQLAEFAGIEIVVQPANRGTGAGVLLPVAHVLARDPEAEVVILPSDHFIERPEALRGAITRAWGAAALAPAGVALIGSAAESAATDLGWMVAAARSRGGVRTVRRFVEKPSVASAFALLGQGALWNTLIMAGRAAAFWRLGHSHIPTVTAALGRYRRHMGARRAAAVLRQIYATLPASDVSRDVLQVARGLGMVGMIDAGWSDCGTPERLARAVGMPLPAAAQGTRPPRRLDVDEPMLSA